jgi:RNA polymerase sigma factor (sigma-70 family)
MKSAADSSIESESETSIVRRFDESIKILSGRFRLDREDLIQVGRMAVLQAFRDWPQKPHTASFWSYARKAVVREMLRYATREFSRTALEIESGLVPAAVCPPDKFLELKEHLASLPEREASVLELHAAGFDVEEIAKKNGVRRTRAYELLGDSMENIRRRA